jgi:hypothetical protein
LEEAMPPVPDDIRKQPPVVPDNIRRQLGIWYKSFVAWRISFFILGGLTILVPLVIASGLLPDWTKGLAFAAAAISGLAAFLKCDERAERFNAAWGEVNAATIRYEHQKNFSINELIDAYERGERLTQSAFLPSKPEEKNETLA